MHDKLLIGVLDRTTNDYYVTACTAPIQIGKQHDVGNQILLDPKYQGVSRVHGVIEQGAHGYVYADKSKNGSQVSGILIRNSRSALGRGFEIRVENYTLSEVELAPMVVLQSDAQSKVVGQMELLPGRGIGLKYSRQGMRLSNLNHWTEWSDFPMAHFEMDGGNAFLVFSDEKAIGEARINKARPSGLRHPIHASDVAEISNQRFEIHNPDEPSLVCGNAACNLLNPHTYEANCKWCGHHLGATSRETRVIVG